LCQPSRLRYDPFSRVPASFSPPATYFTSYERKSPAYAGLFRQAVAVPQLRHGLFHTLFQFNNNSK
ncbi:MAG TPA: hypothetical protein H9839_03295, partial [Candidatus Intestinimonas stercorigallinarum]|nr:hypothetical protein [Candidatus Intestinimonas stercorigallinarum]